MNFLYANDRPGEYPASFYKATADELDAFPQAAGEIKCDVCVIGAGYTGLSTALHLAEKDFDVVLLDAHRVGWGASGRNGGHIGTGQRVEQMQLEKLVGMDAAKQLWRLGLDANQIVYDLSEKHQFDCEIKPGTIHANHRARYGEHSKREAEHLQSVYDYDKISFLDKDAIRDLLETEAYYSGTLDMGAGHLHPLKLAFGLAQAAKKAGVRIFERSEVKTLEQSDPARIITDKANITARFVAIACNGYIGDLDRDAAAHVMQVNNFVIATEPLGDELASRIIANDAAVADSKFVINYYRLSMDKRLVFGGGENYSYNFPSDIKSFVRKPMLEIYPQLADTRIDYGWGGTLGITFNRLPYLRYLKPNILNAGGFSGWGVCMGTFAGSLMARAINGTAADFDVMAAIPSRKFPGGSLTRAPLLALAMFYYALRDRF